MTGQTRCVVWRARQQNRRPLRSLWDQDYGVQLHAIAHWNHHVATDIIKAIIRRLEFLWRLAGKRLRLKR